MNERLRTGLALAGFCVAMGAAAQDRPQALPRIRLNVGILNINAELAKSEEEREVGLMFRTSMAVNDGMIFVFERAGQQCFWMKNTLIPLDVAFIAADGVIVNIDQMKAQTLDSHCSEKAVPYVLEMNDGWFAKRGIRAGQKVRGLPALPQ